MILVSSGLPFLLNIFDETFVVSFTDGLIMLAGLGFNSDPKVNDLK